MALTDAAVKLAEVARSAAPVYESTAALGCSLFMLQTVGHTRLTDCVRLCFFPCPVVLAQSDSVNVFAGGPGAARVRTLSTGRGLLPSMQDSYAQLTGRVHVLYSQCSGRRVP